MAVTVGPPKGTLSINPADISSSVAPLTSSNLSLFHLFWHAHWIVESVIVGLLVCSVWVWAIAIDKTLLFSRLRRDGDQFEEAFWSGQSLEELYKSLAVQPGHSTGVLFVAAMREWKRSLEGHARSFAGLQMRIEKVMNVAIAREVENMERQLLVLATVGSAGPFIGLFGTVAGIIDKLPIDRGVAEHLAGGGRPRHRRVAVRDRNRPRCRHPGDDFL